MKVRNIFNYVVICSFILIFCVKNTHTQEPAIELPIELVGFPVIILAVRLSNFAKKLAYSLNPRTYASRIKRFAENGDMINMDEAEKRLISELGDGVCIYTRVCLYHAEKANRSRSRDTNINWNDIFRNRPRLESESQQTQLPSQFQLSPEKFSKYTGSIKPEAVKSKKIESEENVPKLMTAGYNQLAQSFRKRLRYYRPGLQRYEPQSIMGALEAISYNDKLGCVPRLLCELTAGPNSGTELSSILPFNINMDSVISLVSGLSGAVANPLVQFGRAALLGYSSKGNARSCMFAFPECPQDPDKFVEYLNNYNGGFFRYFNGMPQENPQRLQQYLPQLSQLLPHPNYLQLQQNPQYNQNYGYPHPQRKDIAQKRILTQNNYEQVKFPNNLDGARRIRPFVFPKHQEDEFSFLPQFEINHVPQPMIFPDRTGTGELRLDPEELKINDSNDFFRQPKKIGNNFKFPFNNNNYV